MGTPLMTCDERIANIQRLSHAQAKAEFLALVALRGGYFASRQFDVWIGVERGKRSEDFLADLLDRGHCRRHVFAHNRQAFHLRFARPSAEVLVFRCVDSGSETSGPFAGRLLRYLPLFPELPFFELVYVTTASSRLGQAQTVFERVLSRGRKRPTNLTDPDRLLAHLGDRQLFEKLETSNFDRDRLDRLRDDMDTFSGPHFAEMFARWRPSATKIFAPKLPPRRCRTIAACTEKATDLDALERLHNGVDRAPWRERSKKGPFTSVSMEAFTKDRLQSPSTRAIRPGPWRIDPCFGVKGGAGATPVSVGCAATNSTVLAPASSWVTPAPPPPAHLVFCLANSMANRPLTRRRI